MDINEKRQKIEKLSKKALKLNNEFLAEIRDYRLKGYDIEGEYKVAKTQQEINKILSNMKYHNERQVDNDLERMKDFAKVSWYDYVRFNNKDYKTKRQEQYLAKRVNKALETASSMYDEKTPFKGNSKYTAVLDPLMKELSDELYTVDKGYDKTRPAQLMEHVRFKEIPKEDEDAVAFAKKILKMDWSTKTGQEQWKKQIAHKRYQSFTGKFTDYQLAVYAGLEELMNSSAAWNVVMKDQKPSDGSGIIERRWKKLFDKVESSNVNVNLFDDVKNLIEQEKDYSDILAFIDDGLLKIKQGKEPMSLNEWFA